MTDEREDEALGEAGPASPGERMRAFRVAQGWSRAQLGEQLDCEVSMVGLLERGERLPGRKMANRLEALSANAEGGPIRSEDWDAAEKSTGTEG